MEDELEDSVVSIVPRRHRADRSTMRMDDEDETPGGLTVETAVEEFHAYPHIKQDYKKVVEIVRRWRRRPDGTTPAGHPLPFGEDTEGALRHIFRMTGVQSHEGLCAPTLEDGKALVTCIREDEESLLSFMRMWREDQEAWNDTKLVDAKEVIARELDLVSRQLYYVRVFHHSLTMTLSKTATIEYLPDTAFQDSKYFNEVFAYRSISEIEIKDDRMKMVNHLLKEFEILGYRKKADSDHVFEEVMYTDPATNRRVRTYCYHPTDAVDDVIYKIITKEKRADLFTALIRQNIVSDVANNLLRASHPEFPFLNIKPRYFSFTDGVWDADRDLFCEYDDVAQVFPELLKGAVTYKFIPMPMGPVYWDDTKRTREEADPEEDQGVMDIGEATTRPSQRRRTTECDGEAENSPNPEQTPMPRSHPTPIAPGTAFSTMSGLSGPSTYTPIPSPRTDQQPRRKSAERAKRDWRDIDNPNFEKIFRDQGWSQQSIDLKYATLGRTLWPAGERDNCQYVPVDIGESATGKSTAQNVWQNVFHFSDIMIFGANQEKGFSRDKIATARLFIAPDMRGESFGITPEFFLVLATNDPCVFPRKHKDPLYVESLCTPGMLATNELPPGFRNDVRGSIFRRLLPFGYTKEITPRDPTLKERIIRKELAGVLRKSVGAYNDDTVHPKDKDLMTDYTFSPEIQNERNKLESTSNSLVDFLLSTQVKVDPNGITPLEVFVKAYGDYCRMHRQHKPNAWNQDFFSKPLRSIGASVGTDGDGDAVVFGCTVIRREEDQ